MKERSKRSSCEARTLPHDLAQDWGWDAQASGELDSFRARFVHGETRQRFWLFHLLACERYNCLRENSCRKFGEGREDMRWPARPAALNASYLTIPRREGHQLQRDAADREREAVPLYLMTGRRRTTATTGARTGKRRDEGVKELPGRINLHRGKVADVEEELRTTPSEHVTMDHSYPLHLALEETVKNLWPACLAEYEQRARAGDPKDDDGKDDAVRSIDEALPVCDRYLTRVVAQRTQELLGETFDWCLYYLGNPSTTPCEHPLDSRSILSAAEIAGVSPWVVARSRERIRALFPALPETTTAASKSTRPPLLPREMAEPKQVMFGQLLQEFEERRMRGLDATGRMSDPIVNKGADVISVAVPLSALYDSYIIDFDALVNGERPRHKPSFEAPSPKGKNGNDDNDNDDDDNDNIDDNDNNDKPLTKLKKQKGTRRRYEEEEYDVEDPFIDDAELPLGVTLQDLLQEEAEEEAQGFPKVTNEFFVWKGKLPDREPDPLWEEKALSSLTATNKKGRRKREAKRKRRSSQDDIGKESKQGENGEEPLLSSSQTRRSSKKAKTKESQSEQKRKQKSKSILERITEIGNADEAEVSPVANKPGKLGRRALDLDEDDPLKIDVGGEPAEGMAAAEKADRANGGGEEKVRKKFDISTPFLKLEYELAMAAIREEAQRTDFTDPKKFPSNLRPLVNEAIVCGLRRLDRKTELSPLFFGELAQLLPFSASSLEKLTYSRLALLFRDDLEAKVIPQILEEITAEVKSSMGSGPAAVEEKRTKFNEKIRQLIVDVLRCELDQQALDRLIKARTGLKTDSFSETGIRKAFYPKIAACWPEGAISTVEIGREYNTVKRRQELKKLKEHGIEVVPILIPIPPKAGKGEAVEESSKAESLPNSQPEPNVLQNDLVTRERDDGAKDAEAGVEAVQASGKVAEAKSSTVSSHEETGPSFLETVLNSDAQLPPPPTLPDLAPFNGP